MSSPVLWYATRTTGLVALVLLTVTTVFGVLTATRFATERWPGFAQQDLHRRVSLVSVVFLGGHVLTSVLDSYVHIGWAAVVVPFASDYKRFWVGVGTISLDLMLAVLVTSLLRHRIPARAWRAVHWLAYLSWPVAVAHGLAMGTDMRTAWVLALTATCIAAVVGAVAFRIGSAAVAAGRAREVGAVRNRPAGVGLKHLPSSPATRPATR